MASSGSVATAAIASDQNAVHRISIDYNDNDYESLISAYLASGQKVWIGATVTIDGVTYNNVGLRLDGDSLAAEQDEAEDSDAVATSASNLAWLISLDKYVGGQSHDGATEFVVHTDTGIASQVLA